MKGFVSTALLVAAVAAAPAPEPTPGPMVQRDGIIINNFTKLNSSYSSLSKGSQTAFAAGYTAFLAAISPSATPTNDAQLAAGFSSLYNAYPSAPLEAGGAVLLSGFAGSNPFGNPLDDIQNYGACNSPVNSNPPPPRSIYPKAGASDAPYDIDEATLRSAVYFPPGFTYGKVKPVLFFPGTGGEACEAYANNIGKLLTGSSLGDPVYINVPKNMLDDEQINSEYTAYAVNYVKAITGRNDLALITWSGGAPTLQWAFKYWPSTRSGISSYVAISPDFHGTVLAPLLCPPGLPCSPAVLQQYYTSKYIATLRNNGGANSYVPTTTIWSVFDEIVEPQQGSLASGKLGSSAGQPVTNVQVQDICQVGTFAGGPNFGHENLLYNPVTYALIVDVLKNGGAANVARAGPYNCSQFMATGLTYSDVFATEFLIPYAGFNIETYPNETTTEPPIKAYAQKDTPKGISFS